MNAASPSTVCACGSREGTSSRAHLRPDGAHVMHPAMRVPPPRVGHPPVRAGLELQFGKTLESSSHGRSKTGRALRGCPYTWKPPLTPCGFSRESYREGAVLHWPSVVTDERGARRVPYSAASVARGGWPSAGGTGQAVWTHRASGRCA